MSNRKPYETHAISQLLEHLRTSGRGEFEVIGEHVPVVGGRNCDFLLGTKAHGNRPLAVEIVRAVDNDAELKQESFRTAHWNALRGAFEACGLVGVTVHTPSNLDRPPRDAPTYAAGLAQRAQREFSLVPSMTSIRIDGHTITRTTATRGVMLATLGDLHWVNRPFLAEHLLAVFEDKDLQLAIPDADRVLLVVEWRTDLDAEDLARELAKRPDLDRIRHADEILFLDRQKKIDLIYSRDVRDYFAGSTSFSEHRLRLVEQWLITRLSENFPRTIDLVRSLEAERPGALDLFNAECKAALAHHVAWLVEQGDNSHGQWALDLLRNDPDPAPETSSSSDGIATVRGTVAWLAHRVAGVAPSGELTPVISVVEQFAADRNPYVRDVAKYSVGVLMARRDLRGQAALPESLRNEIKRVWQGYFDLCVPAQADAAALTIRHVYDLTETEVLDILDRLVRVVGHDGMEALTRFALYFAALRPRDDGFTEPFEGTVLGDRVRELIRTNPSFRHQFAWSLWKSVSDHSTVRRAMAPFAIELLSAAPDSADAWWLVEVAGILAADDLLPESSERLLLERLRDSNAPHILHLTFGMALAELNDRLSKVGKASRITAWIAALAPEGKSAFDRRAIRAGRPVPPT